MADGSGSSFGGHERTWAGRVGLARDVVRQEVVRRQLAAHLPPTGRALDVGCGQGTQALALARAGFEVTGVDPSPELLDLATVALADEAADVRERVRFIEGGLPDLPGGIGGDFDVVCCHGVVMYLPSLTDAVAALSGLVAPGGIVSLVSRNRAGIALRAGMTGDWQGAVAGIDANTYRNRLGVDDARAHDPAQVQTAFSQAELIAEAWYGVRLLTDHGDDVPAPADIADIIEAEAAVGAVDPYRQVAALTHTIARNP